MSTVIKTPVDDLSLTDLRTLKGVSQSIAAEALGMSRTMLSHIETNGTDTISTAEKMAEYYGVSFTAIRNANARTREKLSQK